MGRRLISKTPKQENMETRRGVISALILLIPGCSEFTGSRQSTPSANPAEHSPSASPVNTTSDCSGQILMCESQTVTLTSEQQQWVYPVNYESAAEEIQPLLNTILTTGLERCYTGEDALAQLIKTFNSKQERQAREYLDETNSNSLPLYVDSAYIQREGQLYSVFLALGDQILSSGYDK